MYNPRGSWGTPDIGLTEILASLIGAGNNGSGGSNIRGSINAAITAPTTLAANKNLSQNIPPAPIYGPSSTDFRNTLGATDTANLPNKKSSFTTNNQGNNGGIDFNAIIRQAENERNRAMESANGYFGLANDIFGQGMDTLGKRRGEFQNLFDTTSGDILGGYEKNRGELQASAAGARTRSANALRALGLGGSAVINTEGRQQQQNSKALAGLQDQRSQSDRQNRGNFNEQNMWADTQENSLRNYIKEAGFQKAQLESGAGTNFDNILNNIASQQAALAASRDSINGYQANPIAVNADQWINQVGNAGAGLDQLGASGGQDPNAGVNIQEDPAILALLKKQYPTLFSVN